MAKNISVVSPVGKLMWVNITGAGKVNYNKDGRDYLASVVLSADAAEPLLTAINDVFDTNRAKEAKTRSTGYRICNERGDRDEDGKFYIFAFKTRVTFSDGANKEITTFNSSNQKVSMADTRIGNGTTGALSGSIGYYTSANGKEDWVTLWLKSVQVTQLVEYSEDAGFEVQPGDYAGPVDAETGFKSELPATTGRGEEPLLKL